MTHTFICETLGCKVEAADQETASHTCLSKQVAFENNHESYTTCDIEICAQGAAIREQYADAYLRIKSGERLRKWNKAPTVLAERAREEVCDQPKPAPKKQRPRKVIKPKPSWAVEVASAGSSGDDTTAEKLRCLNMNDEVDVGGYTPLQRAALGQLIYASQLMDQELASSIEEKKTDAIRLLEIRRILGAIVAGALLPE